MEPTGNTTKIHLIPRHRPVKVAIAGKLRLKQIRRILRLLRVPQHQISLRRHLPVHIAKDAAAVLLREIQQRIAQHHQVEDRQLGQRRCVRSPQVTVTLPMSGPSAVKLAAKLFPAAVKETWELPAAVCQLSVTVALPVGGTSAFSNQTAPSGGESACNDGGTPIYGVTLNCGACVRDSLGTLSGGESPIPFHFVTCNRII